MSETPKIITVETPPLGGKCWLLEDKGIFVLEQCSGVLRTIACTHAGSGSIAVYDGVPDEMGFFPDHEMEESDPKFHLRNGRPIYRATPVVMGSWMLDAGFFHGLTFVVKGGTASANAIASIVWMPYKERVIKAKVDAKENN